MEARNIRYIEDGRIDCEIDHPKFGWLPFTASPDDVEEFGRLMFDELKDVAQPYQPE